VRGDKIASQDTRMMDTKNKRKAKVMQAMWSAESDNNDTNDSNVESVDE
jgi:hypothetical protein